jgi:hypothetical protein
MELKTKLDLSRYHYRYDPNDPEIHPYYLQYKATLGIPVWCPLSDEEREGFESWYPAQVKQQRKENPSGAANT